ncbi:hypothetical protein FHR75_001270 [Kineococcus radiotolerans]|uniref:Uncharacterized protein n=1 Tax=Kineococcus radiotolerans TaxID=131568 RepID=A0A7W4XWI4_KINRA|nr:hypothetical protein [Kineococcus radiotolerans]MBB2900482.1 hypothetical protein [Kineococcus radiotolerans]
MDELQQSLRIFATQRDCEPFHTSMNLMMALTGEAGELWTSNGLPGRRFATFTLGLNLERIMVKLDLNHLLASGAADL